RAFDSSRLARCIDDATFQQSRRRAIEVVAHGFRLIGDTFQLQVETHLACPSALQGGFAGLLSKRTSVGVREVDEFDHRGYGVGIEAVLLSELFRRRCYAIVLVGETLWIRIAIDAE